MMDDMRTENERRKDEEATHNKKKKIKIQGPATLVHLLLCYVWGRMYWSIRTLNHRHRSSSQYWTRSGLRHHTMKEKEKRRTPPVSHDAGGCVMVVEQMTMTTTATTSVCVCALHDKKGYCVYSFQQGHRLLLLDQEQVSSSVPPNLLTP